MKMEMDTHQRPRIGSRMLKGIICALLVLSYTSLCMAAPSEEKKFEEEHKVNCGVRAGFNSSLFFVSDFNINGNKINDYYNNYKLGYFGTFFIRVNMKRHFIQPEFTYNVNKGEMSFDKMGSVHPAVEPKYAAIKSSLHCLELPILYGYNIIKRDPYSLSVLVGPKVRYILQKQSKLRLESDNQIDLDEKLYPLAFNMVAGISVSISKVYFDFRYEQGVHNISKSIGYTNQNPTNPVNLQQITLKRREQVISFALGVIF